MVIVVLIVAALLGIFYYLGGEKDQSVVEQPVALPDKG